MKVYRVYDYVPGAEKGKEGHHDYVHLDNQGKYRLDNKNEYVTRYYARDPAGAIAESFGGYSCWQESMFCPKYLSGGRKVLGSFYIDIDALCDMDSVQTLDNLSLPPSRVVVRNRRITQDWALKIFREKQSHDSSRKWDGVQWWSYYNPDWTIYCRWVVPTEKLPHEFGKFEHLSLDHDDVREAKKIIRRKIKRKGVRSRP